MINNDSKSTIGYLNESSVIKENPEKENEIDRSSPYKKNNKIWVPIHIVYDLK